MILPRRFAFAVALACAAIAGLAYYADARRVPVVVAARAIASESTLSADDLTVADLPPAAVPRDAIAAAAEAVGRTVRTALAPGQLVLASTFEGEPGFRSGIVTPPGWRAVALPASPATALGGAVAPGMRVDVVAVPIAGKAPANRLVERLGSQLLVLDVRSEPGGPYSEPGATGRGSALVNARLGSLVVAIPPQDDLRFAERIATSTFIVFRSP